MYFDLKKTTNSRTTQVPPLPLHGTTYSCVCAALVFYSLYMLTRALHADLTSQFYLLSNLCGTRSVGHPSKYYPRQVLLNFGDQ